MKPYQQERFEIIQEALAVLAEACLDFDISTQTTQEIPPKFDDEDVINCVIIANTVLSNRAVHAMQEQKIKLKDGEELSFMLGDEFRKLIRGMTGIDMHKIN